MYTRVSCDTALFLENPAKIFALSCVFWHSMFLALNRICGMVYAGRCFSDGYTVRTDMIYLFIGVFSAMELVSVFQQSIVRL